MIRNIHELRISDIDKYVGNQEVINMLDTEIVLEKLRANDTRSVVVRLIAETKIETYQRIKWMLDNLDRCAFLYGE